LNGYIWYVFLYFPFCFTYPSYWFYKLNGIYKTVHILSTFISDRIFQTLKKSSRCSFFVLDIYNVRLRYISVVPQISVSYVLDILFLLIRFHSKLRPLWLYYRLFDKWSIVIFFDTQQMLLSRSYCYFYQMVLLLLKQGSITFMKKLIGFWE